MIQGCPHPVQLSTTSVCTICQASPNKQVKGDSDKEPKLHWWQKWRREKKIKKKIKIKTWQKPGSVQLLSIIPDVQLFLKTVFAS